MIQRILGTVIIIGLFLTCVSCSKSDKDILTPKDFSANIVTTHPQGTTSAKIFVTKGKIRMETPQVVTISRIDKNLVWVLMPSQKMYMEQEMKPEYISAGGSEFPGEVKRERLGKETLNGEKTIKYKITYKTEDTEQTIFQWISVDLGLPIRTEAEDGSWMNEYKDLKKETPPESLFEIPEGYKKFAYQMPKFK
jgi:hypothetical protein